MSDYNNFWHSQPTRHRKMVSFPTSRI